MIYKDLIEKGLVKKEEINFSQVAKVMVKAQKDLKSAIILLENEQNENAYELAYESMISTGRALIFSHNLRPRAQGSHKITIEFMKKVLGESNDLLIKKLEKTRKKRHYLIYGVGLEISLIEAKNAIENAQKLVKIVIKFIEDKNPQKKLL